VLSATSSLDCIWIMSFHQLEPRCPAGFEKPAKQTAVSLGPEVWDLKQFHFNHAQILL